MVEVVFRVDLSEDVRERLREHPEIAWARVVKRAVTSALDRIILADFLESKLKKSEFNEKESILLSKKVKDKRFKELKAKKII